MAVPRVDVTKLARSRIEDGMEDGPIRVVDLQRRGHHLPRALDPRIQMLNTGRPAQRRPRRRHLQSRRQSLSHDVTKREDQLARVVAAPDVVVPAAPARRPGVCGEPAYITPEERDPNN